MTSGARRLRLAIVFGVLAVTVAWGGAAQAYVRALSKPGNYDLIWPDPNVYLVVYTGGSKVSPSDFVAAATEAAATWSAPRADTSVKITVTSNPAAPAGAAFDHENTISFRTVNWDAPTYPELALALTTIFTSGGAIVETDTEINAVDPAFHWAILADDPAVAMLSTDDDVQNALTHEMGHVLGLAHPCYLGLAPDPPMLDNLGQPVLSCSAATLPSDVLTATMYPTADPGNIGERTLSSDEVTALRDLYPAGRAPKVDGPVPPGPAGGGCSVAGSSRRGPSPLEAIPVFFVGVAIAIRRRRG
jgi:hypothetical protein